LKQSVVHSTAKPDYVSRQLQGWMALLEADFALHNKRQQRHCCSAKNQRLPDVMHLGKQQTPPPEHPIFLVINKLNANSQWPPQW